jgi:CRP-like cAMP-binding protein
MSLDAIVVPLLRAPLFSGLTPLQLKIVALSAERVTFDDGDALINEGEQGDAAFLVVSGTLERLAGPLNGGEREAYGPGTLVGELAMLIETEHTSTVVASGSVRALRFTREVMHEIFQSYPDIAGHFVQRLTQRLSGIAARLHEIDRRLAGEDEIVIPEAARIDAAHGVSTSLH